MVKCLAYNEGDLRSIPGLERSPGSWLEWGQRILAGYSPWGCKELDTTERLHFHFQKNKIMASSPITSWQIDGEAVETVTDFILGGSTITADGDCSHEIKRCLLLGRKAMTNLDSIFTWPTKVCLVKAMVFPVVMYGCESWTINKAECQRIDAFECGIGEDSWESLGLQGDQTS